MTSDKLVERPAVTSPTQLPAFGGTGGERRPVLKGLIAVNVVVAVVGLAMIAVTDGLDVGGVLFDGVSRLHELGEMSGEKVDSGQVWRLLTPMVLHYGVVHLLANMVMLGLAGWRLEPLLGSARFLTLYVLSGLAASVATYFFDYSALTAGASGANFGTFAALLVVCLRLRIRSWLAIGLLLFGVVTTFAIPGMAIAAHFGGLLAGTVVAAGYAWASGDRKQVVQWVVPVATMAVLVLSVAVGALT